MARAQTNTDNLEIPNWREHPDAAAEVEAVRVLEVRQRCLLDKIADLQSQIDCVDEADLDSVEVMLKAKTELDQSQQLNVHVVKALDAARQSLASKQREICNTIRIDMNARFGSLVREELEILEKLREIGTAKSEFVWACQAKDVMPGNVTFGNLGNRSTFNSMLEHYKAHARQLGHIE